MTHLHPNLAPYVYDRAGEPFLDHPIVSGPLGFRDAAEVMNRVYIGKLDAIEKAAEEGDWDSYGFLHERPYRFEALEDVECTGSEYGRLVRHIWIDSENIWRFEEEWRSLLPSDSSWHHLLMDADERAALAALPDPVPVFRGYSRDGRDRGLSWTTDRERADWFAHRLPRSRGHHE